MIIACLIFRLITVGTNGHGGTNGNIVTMKAFGCPSNCLKTVLNSAKMSSAQIHWENRTTMFLPSRNVIFSFSRFRRNDDEGLWTFIEISWFCSTSARSQWKRVLNVLHWIQIWFTRKLVIYVYFMFLWNKLRFCFDIKLSFIPTYISLRFNSNHECDRLS